MPAGNKDLMYLIANRAGGAKEQYGHATGAYAPRTPGKANHDHRGEQPDEEKFYGMGNATDVRAHPHANGSKSARPDIRGSRIGAPGHSVLCLGFTRGIGSLNARSLTLHQHARWTRSATTSPLRFAPSAPRCPPALRRTERSRSTRLFSSCAPKANLRLFKYERV